MTADTCGLAGSITLSATSDGHRVKIWLDAARTAEVPLPKTWNSVTELPNALYMDGVEASTNPRDVHLQLAYDGSSAYLTSTPIRDTVSVTVLNIDLDVDTDRNGTVGGTEAEDAAEMSYPAIISVNNDDDDGKPAPLVDCPDNIVNGLEDVKDLAELIIRSVPALPTGWKAVLSVPPFDAEHIRIFDGRATTSVARIGPVGSGLPNEYEIPDMSADLTCGVEAVDYANPTYSGTTTVSIVIRRADNTEFARDDVKLKTAPFILADSTRPI